MEGGFSLSVGLKELDFSEFIYFKKKGDSEVVQREKGWSSKVLFFLLLYEI